jgi:Tol biopolymer transport system component
METGEIRRLTEGVWPAFAYPSRFSPDGRRIAFGWRTEEGEREIRIIGRDGSGLRTAFSGGTTDYPEPHAWSPNGRTLAAYLEKEDGSRQIFDLTVEDGTTRLLLTLRDEAVPMKMAFSSDGRRLAFDYPQSAGRPERDVYILDIDAGTRESIVEHPADDFLLDWLPQDQGLLFASNREGTWGLWALDMADPAVAPRRLAVSPTRIRAGLGFTADGSYYFGASFTHQDLYVTTVGADSGELRDLQKVGGGLSFDSSPAWSPDGRHLAFVTGDGDVGYSFVLHIRDIKTHTERELPLPLTRLGGHAFQPQWSPDGESFLVQADSLDGKRGLFLIDRESGELDSVALKGLQDPGAELEWPTWVGPGRIAFTRWVDPWPGRQLMVRELETGGETEVYRTAAPLGVSHLAGSPDGQKVAFFEWNAESTQTSLQVVPARGGEALRLCELNSPDRSSYGQLIVALAWTPDAKSLIYAASPAAENRQTRLWTIPATGGSPKPIGGTLEGLLPYGLSVHPDASRVALTAGLPRRREVWMIKHLQPVR